MDEKLLNQARDCFENTLRSVVGSNRSNPRDIEFATKLVCALKAIEEMGGEGASFMSGNSNRGSYQGGGSNRSGMSGRRSYRSYEGGYSGHDIKQAMREKMEELMDEADSDMDRRMVEDMMHKLDGVR